MATVFNKPDAAQHETTRQRLLAAAGPIFAAKGFAGATVREICQQAASNLAAINYHFGDKEKLYVAVMAEVTASKPCVGESSNDDPALALDAFIRGFLWHLLEESRPAWHAQLLLREMIQPMPACLELVEAFIRPNATRLEAMVRRLTADSMTEAERWLCCFSIISQCLFYKIHRIPAEMLVGSHLLQAFDLNTLADHITRFSLAGLQAKDTR